MHDETLFKFVHLFEDIVCADIKRLIGIKITCLKKWLHDAVLLSETIL